MIYESDQEKARNYAQKIGLESAPWAHAHLSALADHEVNLMIVRSSEDFDEPVVTAPVEQGSKEIPTTVEPQQSIEVTTTPTPQAPVAKTVGKMNLRQLMKAFLSGEITKPEYDAKRKALKYLLGLPSQHRVHGATQAPTETGTRRPRTSSSL